ncbi:hypothetical protein IID22_04700 [Patescibacteria group bacterium]|nr:hypothetical protein [Patescibacteria group bacterium]
MIQNKLSPPLNPPETLEQNQVESQLPPKRRDPYHKIVNSTYFKIILTAVLMLFIFLIAFFIALLSELRKQRPEQFDQGVPPAEVIIPSPEPTLKQISKIVPPTWNEDQQVVASVFDREKNNLTPPLAPNEELVLLDIRVEGNWATGEVTLYDKNTDKPLVGEATLFLFRKQNQQWSMATKGTDQYKEWLDEVPTSLIPEDLKIFLR